MEGLIGYVRVSKNDGSQLLDLQLDALQKEGVSPKRIYEDFSVLLSEFAKTIDESCDEIATAVSRSRIN